MELKVSDLAVTRGGVTVLSGISFAVGAGQALVLRGPNGIGKTTVLRTIAGLQPAQRGTIEPGVDRLAYAGHADALKASLTVRENLTFWAKIHGTGAQGEAMKVMELQALAERQAQNLSAGQKRRLGLARLLVADRPVWLLDEPTVSLDMASVALFGRVLRGHLERGGIALLATHIDLGLPDAKELDLIRWRADNQAQGFAPGFDEAFL
ncbi:MAG: heme ABC exporter ATP-binding protein CcmA [Paracoccaceae bacterium]